MEKEKDAPTEKEASKKKGKIQVNCLEFSVSLLSSRQCS
jgi:hypothetical protein